MKPLNLDNRPCSPISSNCVIYQGPDIPCIKLCTGDTVSDIIAKLGTELCTIMDQLNVTNYDLSCLDINACPPADFQALIQLLIDKICEANGVTVTPEKASGCPDCVVSVAPCFVQGNQTTMQLVDYVQMIANRVCSILDQINVINNQITNLDNRVTVLENTPPPTFTLPSIDTECLATYMGNLASAPIDQVLNTLLNNDTIGYCALIQATGEPAEILSAVASQCISSTDPSLASLSEGDSPVEPMSTYYNGTWINSAVTAADAINNLWISICDIRTYLTNFAIDVEDTNSVNLNYIGGTLSANIQDTGWVDLLGFDFYSGNSITAYKPKCRRIGNVVHFRGMLMIPLSSNGTGGGSALPWEYGAVDTYISNTTVAPFTGNGGVTFDNNGSLTFNSNGTTSLPVIPLTVMNAGTTFDSIVQSNYVVASRFIKLPSNDSAMLTTVVRIWIKSDKTLVLQYLKDNEYSAGGKAANITGTSVLNTLVSRVNLGDRLPQFARAGSEIAGNTTAGQQPLTATYYAGSPASETYPFTCNAGDPNNTGGFGWLSIDGMMAYINPCTTDIKNYNCP
jgi:hypothetical protein